MKSLGGFLMFPTLQIVFLAMPAPPLEAANTGGAAGSLTFLGRATVKIVTSEGIVIYIDPYAPGDYSQPADILLVTHGHMDHNKVQLVKLKPGARVLAPAGTIEGIGYDEVTEGSVLTFGSVSIRVVPAYNKKHDRASSVGYLVSWNGVTVYHAGDTSLIPEMKDFSRYQITYALLNCDAVFNMDPAEASEVGRVIGAEHIIPIHSSGAGMWDRKNASKVTGKDVIIIEPGQTVSLFGE